MDKTFLFKNLKYSKQPLLNAIKINIEADFFKCNINHIDKTSKLSKLVNEQNVRNIIIELPVCEHEYIKNMYDYTSIIIDASLKQAVIDNCIIVSSDTVFKQIFIEEIDRNSFLRFFDNIRTASTWLERYEAQITVV